ncbi:MAG TPA: HIT domain-containing protein [Pyrinomonadaceae bacterium]|nr:HIT domain-containing protein [Pyrinomonadaceae bacterium]
MQTLWSPWRSKYVGSGSSGSSQSECVFCLIQQNPEHDEQSFVVHRGISNFVVLNLFPYITGHLLIVPYAHVGELYLADSDTTNELMELAKRCQVVLREVYAPAGFNVGMNLGEAAGAGIVGHLHLHILPRWAGDTNFMTTTGETRVIPEGLATTYEKLRGKF